jgi:hypothetical protein
VGFEIIFFDHLSAIFVDISKAPATVGDEGCDCWF